MLGGLSPPHPSVIQLKKASRATKTAIWTGLRHQDPALRWDAHEWEMPKIANQDVTLQDFHNARSGINSPTTSGQEE
jgi:hypothetical protein